MVSFFKTHANNFSNWHESKKKVGVNQQPLMHQFRMRPFKPF
jgi:hypothetical protein